MTENCQFVPVIGSEDKIDNYPITPGYMYVAKDSGKIYVDTSDSDGNQSRVTVGGAGSAIYYASDSSPIDTGLGYYTLVRSSISDEHEALKENDLIINTANNCFYKVVQIDDSTVNAVRIAVAGSSSGGSSGGDSGGGTVSGTASVSRVTSRDIYILYGDECNIEFNVIAKNALGEDTDGGSVSWTLSSVPIATQSIVCGNNTFNVASYLTNKTSAQTLKGTFSLDVGSGTDTIITLAWNIYVIDVTLKWDYDLSTINSGDTVTLSYSVVGNNTISKVLNFTIDGLAYTEEIGSTVGAKTLNLNKDIYGFSHGKHTISMWLEFEVNSNKKTTEPISYEVFYVDSENNNPIIITDTNKYSTSIQQYDTAAIPVYIYNASNANIYIDGVQKQSWSIDTQVYQNTINYSPISAGESIVRIVCGSDTEYVINFNVSDLGISIKEVSDWTFRLKASEFIDNTSLKEDEDLEFSDNFDWVNGGLQSENDENGNARNYILIKSGTRLTLKCNPFESFDINTGKCLKIIFKVINCGNYDAEILSCLGLSNPDASEENQRNIGLHLFAQDGYLYSQLNTVRTRYCEDNYIEYEIDIAPHGDKQYIMPWLDGVPSGITVYGNSDEFSQHASEVKDIVIGSDDCDVCLYLFKTYEKHLTDEEHLNNFIMDASNAQEISERYSRNDILSDTGNGEIDYEKVIEKNPNCWIHLYKIPRITKNKKDKIDVNYYALYKNGDTTTPVIQSGNDINLKCSAKVQGTSSEKYVISAANLDTDFTKGGFLTSEGETVSTFQLDDTVPGEAYFNTKVNVASCEGANNALNAAWYFDHQPYVCAARKKNSLKRDTMLFKPGIIFMIDENTKFEKTSESDTNLDLNVFKGDSNYQTALTSGNPFYKQYAICNFGNSKKNIQTLHDPDNEYEICIEVTDNQNFGQHMTEVPGKRSVTNDEGEVVTESVDLTDEVISYDDETGGNSTYTAFKESLNDGDFDVRYANGSDGVDSASPQQIMAFFNLIKWFTTVDPCPKDENHPHGYTGEDLSESVTFGEKTFKEKNWLKDDTVLGGLTYKKYAGTYTKDTKEYRIAKFLNECEDHLIMDSIVYHYLFIERHLMVDNVAKNTFWSSEDENNQYWCLVKDYDNDTADGIDNDGKLVFSYGVEPGDINEDTGLSYFNAGDSVWFNLLQNLDEVNQKMYQSLGLTGTKTWSAAQYLEKFNDWQGCIPERCWIEDYYRKYVRPYEVFSDSGYLARLEGGKKKFQRAQFETYEEIYMNTKYADVSETSCINIRANSANPKNISIPVKMYSDCYIYQSWSQNIVKIRAKRNTEYLITCPDSVSDLTNATVYWYAPETYSSIGNIGTLSPQSVDMGESKRLQKLEISGTLEDGLPSLTSDSAPSFNQAVLLKTLTLNYLDNLKNGSGVELDLSGLSFLKEFEAIGSNFTSIILPSGAPLVSVKINNPSSLKASNLRYLQTLEDSAPEKISSLYIKNIDNSEINSLNDIVKQVVAKTGNNFTYYDLEDVQWVIDDASDLDTTNNTINILELLTKKTPKTFEGGTGSKEKSLTGTLLISSSAYSGDNSLTICEKYETVFPNLDINFEDENCKLYKITVIDGNGNTILTKKYRKETDLSVISLSEEELAALKTRASSESYVYSFNNSWKITYSDGTEKIFENENTCADSGQIVQDSDVTVEPLFESEKRKYTISYYSNDGAELFTQEDIAFGTKISEAITLAQISPYQDDSSLDLEKTYIFKGWTTAKGGSTVLANYSERTVTGNITFYAIFEVGDVHNNPTSTEYFTWRESTLTSPYYSDISGIVLSPKDSNILKGKITIPAKINNINVIAVEGFNGVKEDGSSGKPQSELTHVFFETGTVVKVFLEYAFDNCSSNLQYIEIPSTIEYLGGRCCSRLSSLELPDLSKCTNLEYIGTYVFYSISNTDKSVFYIPSSVKIIGLGVLEQIYTADFYTVDTVYLGTSDKASQLTTYLNPSNNVIGYGVTVNNLIVYAPSESSSAYSFEDHVYEASNKSRTIV